MNTIPFPNEYNPNDPAKHWRPRFTGWSVQLWWVETFLMPWLGKTDPPESPQRRS
jgi:hypothetical protein